MDELIGLMAGPPEALKNYFTPLYRRSRKKRWDAGLSEYECPACHIVKPINEFRIQNLPATENGQPTIRAKLCIPCEKLKGRGKWIRRPIKMCIVCGQSTGSAKKKYCEACKKLLVKKWKKIVMSKRGDKCERCGFTHPASDVFDFHHKDPATKEKKMVQIMSWEEFLSESDKCLLLCANCHRIVHWEERQAKRAAVQPKRKVKETAQLSLLPI
jgi:RecJ-like exonuclease